MIFYEKVGSWIGCVSSKTEMYDETTHMLYAGSFIASNWVRQSGCCNLMVSFFMCLLVFKPVGSHDEGCCDAEEENASQKGECYFEPACVIL